MCGYGERQEDKVGHEISFVTIPRSTISRVYDYTQRINLVITRSTQPGHPFVGRNNEYQRKLGRKQAHRAIH